MLTALQIGTEATLLESRKGLIEMAGLRVITARSAAEGISRIGSTHFDLVILCHSLQRNEQALLAAAVRSRRPGTAILMVEREWAGRTPENQGVAVILQPDPGKLVTALRQFVAAREIVESV